MSEWPENWRPQAVVFDLDGLMFNTEDLYQEVGGAMLHKRGKRLDAELLDAMMGRQALAALQIMIDWHGLDDTAEQLALETEQIFSGILAERLECMPGLVDLLASLERAGVPKAIATSSGASFVAKVLAKFDFAPRFQFILTAEDITDGKPHPQIYLTAAGRFALPPHNLLVLEDSYNGCQAAIQAGTFAVAVPSGHSRRHDFSGAALVIESLADERLYLALGIERFRAT